VAELEAKSALQAQESKEKIAALDKELADTKELLAAAQESVTELTGKLDTTTKDRDETATALAQARARVAELETDLASTKAELGTTQSKLASESAAKDKALKKWDADKVSLDRAKDALAVVLAQIEEAESRSIAG
jgi:chromosome segregation ATPase